MILVSENLRINDVLRPGFYRRLIINLRIPPTITPTQVAYV